MERPPTPHRRPARTRWRGVLLTALGVALTAFIALSISVIAARPEETPPPTPAEQALDKAGDDATRLAERAEALAGSAPAEHRNPLRATGSLLRDQTSLLHGHAALAEQSAPTAPAQPSGSPPPGDGTPPVKYDAGSAEELVSDLLANAKELRAALPPLAEDSGASRLLASAAAGQSLQAERLARALGFPPSEPDDPLKPTIPASPPCPDDTTPTATASSPVGGPLDAAAAFTAVQEAEGAAVYALEIALATARSTGQDEDPVLADSLSAHHRALDSLQEAADALCVVLPPAPAAYSLHTSSPTSSAPSPQAPDPTAALTRIEDSTPVAWSILTAAVPAEGKHWAATELTLAARRALPQEVSVPAFPGLSDPQEATTE